MNYFLFQQQGFENKQERFNQYSKPFIIDCKVRKQILIGMSFYPLKQQSIYWKWTTFLLREIKELP